MFRSPTICWGAIFLAVGLLCDSCGRSNAGSKPGAADRAMPAPVVRIGTVEVKNVPIYGDFVGQTEAKEIAVSYLA